MIGYAPHMLPKVRSKAITQSARGRPCTLRIASFIGLPCDPVETVVFAHLQLGGHGQSTKETDMAGVYGCCICHAIQGGHDQNRLEVIKNRYPLAYGLRLASAMRETQAMMIADGIIVVPDGVII